MKLPMPALRGLAVATAALLTVCLATGCAQIQSQQALSAARKQAEAGNLEGAARAYEAILQANPGNTAASAELEGVRDTLVEQAVARAETVADGSGPEAVRLREAIEVLDGAAQHDPQGRRRAAAKTRFEERLRAAESQVESHLAQSRARADAGRMDEARAEIAAARAIDPGHPELSRAERAIALAEADLLIGQIERALGRRDLEAARAALRELEALGADPERAAQVRAEFAQHELAILREQVTENLRLNRYYTAYLAVIESGREAELARLVDTIRMNGAPFYRDQARMRLERDEPERAYLEAVKGIELDASTPGLFELHRDARDRVQAELQQYIAVPTFGAPRDQPDLGAQFSDALISHLFRVLPYGIHIAEREKIDLVMREQGFAEAGDVLDVDLIVSGNVSLLKIDHQNQEQTALARVQIGERTEPNPAYDAALRARNNATTSTSSRNVTAPPPPPLPPATISVPEFETVRYKRGSSQIKGFATVAARIFDTRKGSIAYAQEFNAKFEVADEYQDAVDQAGIQGDPIELPTDTEVAEALRNKLVGQLSDLIRSQFDDRAASYLSEARYYLTRREVDRAMKPMAQGFLYGVQAQVPAADSSYASLLDLIVEQTERGFLPGSLGSGAGPASQGGTAR